jgi:hypothetical protein
VGWLYAAVVGVPFVLLLVQTGIESPDQFWGVALIALVTVPVIILPWAVAFWYPEEERRRREQRERDRQGSVEPRNR